MGEKDRDIIELRFNHLIQKLEMGRHRGRVPQARQQVRELYQLWLRSLEPQPTRWQRLKSYFKRGE